MYLPDILAREELTIDDLDDLLGETQKRREGIWKMMIPLRWISLTLINCEALAVPGFGRAWSF